jgi:hypothetical protein
MQMDIEIWLRGNDFATTEQVDVEVDSPAAEWTDQDVRRVLTELLRAIDRAKHPEANRQRPVSLRGFSWIVSPFEKGGYTITVEIQLGAAAAGPFDVDRTDLEATITRLLAADRVTAPARGSIH